MAKVVVEEVLGRAWIRYTTGKVAKRRLNMGKDMESADVADIRGRDNREMIEVHESLGTQTTPSLTISQRVLLAAHVQTSPDVQNPFNLENFSMGRRQRPDEYRNADQGQGAHTVPPQSGGFPQPPNERFESDVRAAAQGPWTGQQGWRMGQVPGRTDGPMRGMNYPVYGYEGMMQMGPGGVPITRYREKLPQVKSDSVSLAADVIYTVERAEARVKEHTVSSVYSALERALPPDIVRRFNRGGRLSLEQLCDKLRQVYNSPMLLYEEGRKIEMFRVDNKDSMVDDIMNYIYKVGTTT